jgi:hypothetical protein
VGNADVSIVLLILGSQLTHLNLQVLNELGPIDLTLLGINTSVRLVQLANDPVDIVVILEGMTILYNVKQL